MSKRRKPIPAGTLVLVTWRDIESKGDWNEEPSSEECPVHKTAYYLKYAFDLRKVDTVFCSTLAVGEGSLHDHTSIPTGCIDELELLTGESVWKRA